MGTRVKGTETKGSYTEGMHTRDAKTNSRMRNYMQQGWGTPEIKRLVNDGDLHVECSH